MARLMGETGEGHDSERHRLHVRLYLGIVKKVTICEKSDKLGGFLPIVPKKVLYS